MSKQTKTTKIGRDDGAILPTELSEANMQGFKDEKPRSRIPTYWSATLGRRVTVPE